MQILGIISLAVHPGLAQPVGLRARPGPAHLDYLISMPGPYSNSYSRIQMQI